MKITLFIVPLLHFIIGVHAGGGNGNGNGKNTTPEPAATCDYSVGSSMLWGEIDFIQYVSTYCSDPDTSAVQQAASEALECVNTALGSNFALDAPGSERRGLRGNCEPYFKMYFGRCNRRRLSGEDEEEKPSRKLTTGSPCPAAVVQFEDSSCFPQKLLDAKNAGTLSDFCYYFVTGGVWDFDAYVGVTESI